MGLWKLNLKVGPLWYDQAKSVWSRSNSVFTFLTNCMQHFHSFILQKTPLKLVDWFQRYEQLKDAKNNRKQKKFSALFGCILKLIFPTSNWFCLITSHLSFVKIWWGSKCQNLWLWIILDCNVGFALIVSQYFKIRILLTSHNWQKWKSTFLTYPCHKNL